MINLLKTDVFFKRYAVYFSGSMVVAFLNYVFHPILGRLLSPVEFGDLQALLSLIAQTAILFGTFSVIVVNITTNAEDVDERNAIISELQKIALWIVGVFFILLLISISSIRSFFNFSSIYPLLGLLVILPLSATTTFRNAFLQGSGRFGHFSLGGIIYAGSRLLLSAILVIFGLNIFGATLGIVLAYICLLTYLIYQTKDSLRLTTKVNVRVLEKGSVKKELKYGILVLFTTGLVTLLYTSDVLIVKHYFSLADAGLYSGISAIAKIMFFAITPISAVLLSTVKLKSSFKENSIILMKSLGIASVIGSVGIITFYLFRDTIITLMIGQNYASFAHFLPKAGLIMMLTAVVSILIYYFMALRRFFLITIALVGMISLGYILFQGHSSIETILNNLLLAIGTIITLLTIVYAKDYLRYRSGLQ